VLDWLGAQPGDTWQQRWIATGAGVDGRTDWKPLILQWLVDTGRIAPTNRTARETLGTGLLQLLGGDVIRPDMVWLLTSPSPKNLAVEMARVRDPVGFAELIKLAQAATTGGVATNSALIKVSIILAAKGGTVRDITVGDALQLVQIAAEEGRSNYGKSPYFYQLLHAMGAFPAAAPSTIRAFSPNYPGQPTVEQLIDRYELVCRPVRDLLVAYLRERQPGVDFRTLQGIATNLGLSFWKDLENHHPGICSLRLAPDVAAAWKQRIQTRPSRSKNAGGDAAQSRLPEVAFTLWWTPERGGLVGALEARNVCAHRFRLSGKPILTPIGTNGEPLDAETIVTLDLRLPDYVELAPGERAKARRREWGGAVGMGLPPAAR
jgi:hypothetical protein